MPQLHEFERVPVAGPDAVPVSRLVVPGGWIYRLGHDAQPVFVPRQQRLAVLGDLMVTQPMDDPEFTPEQVEAHRRQFAKRKGES